jgi:hypothetical protein
MKDYRFDFKVAGIFEDEDAAAAACRRLIDSGFRREQTRTLGSSEIPVDKHIEPETEATRDQLIRDTLIGTGVGGVAGGAATAGLATLMPTFFVSAPVVGPLVVLGYGAMLGSIGGAATGLSIEKTHLAALIKDAIEAGCYVLLVHVEDEQEYERAKKLLGELVAEEVPSG